MKKWSFGKKFLVFLIVGFIVLFGYRKFFAEPDYQNDKESYSKNKILNLEVSGVIMNGKKFLKNLKKYKKDKNIKAIVIDINSPGGAVGPSQEIYYEITRAKNETKKPVICVSTGLMASGGYYSALACDKIVVAPGAMVGSIGVIMEFANLQRLYDWAKVERYSLKSGKFKDSGAEYRPMRDDEKELFQNMIDEVYMQFKSTVMTARNLDEATVSAFADGRVMTGATAVKNKFADQEGTFEDAIRLAAQMANLGDDYQVVKPSKDKENLWDLVMSGGDDEDELNSVDGVSKISSLNAGPRGTQDLVKSIVSGLTSGALHPELLNRPLYLMPGYL